MIDKYTFTEMETAKIDVLRREKFSIKKLREDWDEVIRENPF